jgi:hypothetical protein
MGAVCGNAARAVLCEGRSVMIVPTATLAVSRLFFYMVLNLPMDIEIAQIFKKPLPFSQTDVLTTRNGESFVTLLVDSIHHPYDVTYAAGNYNNQVYDGYRKRTFHRGERSFFLKSTAQTNRFLSRLNFPTHFGLISVNRCGWMTSSLWHAITGRSFP